MNARTRFILKLLFSLLLAVVAAAFISHDLVSFALVSLIAAYAFCPVRALKPHPRTRHNA